MKTTMVILLAITFVMVGIMLALGYLLVEWLVPHLAELTP